MNKLKMVCKIGFQYSFQIYQYQYNFGQSCKKQQKTYLDNILNSLRVWGNVWEAIGSYFIEIIQQNPDQPKNERHHRHRMNR